MGKSFTAALCNPRVILGGRHRVIRATVSALNDLGIEPDILCGHKVFTDDQEAEKYGSKLKATYRILRSAGMPGEIGLVWFNVIAGSHFKQYDLVVNFSNSLMGLPQHPGLVTYMLYPRKARLIAPVRDIHCPEIPYHSLSPYGIYRKLMKTYYRIGHANLDHTIVCMTQFTAKALGHAYGRDQEKWPIIYPPADLMAFHNNSAIQRNLAVASTGRFTRSKRQLEQIHIAEQMPEVEFHIIGFTGDSAYFRSCQQHIHMRGLKNVHLHPNVSLKELNSIMATCKYFLHALVNEPFGLSAVEAVAGGCIPIVHDSGGQRETVPFPELRFQTLAEVPGIIRQIESASPSDIKSLKHSLQQHIRIFDQSVFINKFKPILSSVLENRMSK